MVKKLFFIAVLLASASICFSQSDFREGYVITLANDTIHGLINNKGSFRNLKQCRFKPSRGAGVIDYTPEEIKAFRIYSAGYYVSIEVEMNGKRELSFIEKLIEGIVDVFYFKVMNDAFF